MSFGQMAEIIFMIVMPFFFRRLGVKWMLAMGMLAWVVRYGLFSAAFFLSRSYTVVMYLLIALVVGHYMGARQRWPGVPLLRLSDHWMRWLAVSVASIVALYIITTILLIGS